MEHLHLLAAAVVLAAAAAGCVGDDLASDSTRAEPDDGRNGALAPRQNRTRPQELNHTTESFGSGNETSGNGTGNGTDEETSPDEDGPALPGNLTMDGAEAVARNGTAVTFLWNGTLPASSSGGASVPRVGRLVDVPDGLPLRVNASIAWDGRRNLDVRLRSPGVEAYCVGDEACGVRTFARSGWDRWNVTVEEGPGPASETATPFTAEVTVQLADPWTGPPVTAPEPASGTPADPGWPAIEEADIRPGAKFELGTANFVFSGSGNRTLYMGWIAHGVDGMEPGETLTLNLPGGEVQATLVYCSWGLVEETVTCPELDAFEHPRAANDFALVQLPAEARNRIHPATLYWGGPTGLAAPPSQGDQVRAFGNTDLRDGDQAGVNPLDPQLGVVRGANERGTTVNVLPPAVPGDSGSPVLTADGAAVGTMSTLTLTTTDGLYNGVANLEHALRVMEENTGLAVELETWRLFDRPRARDLVGPAEGP